jgi:hypothetical protein
MSERADQRVDYIKSRIANGFPKLAGSKLDKLLGTDEIRQVFPPIYCI